VIDLFSRQVAGWSNQPDMRRNLELDALDVAWLGRNPGKETIAQGSHGSCQSYQPTSGLALSGQLRAQIRLNFGCFALSPARATAARPALLWD
jgi:transposase InsO family protein